MYRVYRGDVSDAERGLASIQAELGDVDTFWGSNGAAAIAQILMGLGELDRAAEIAMVAALQNSPDYYPITVALAILGAIDPGRASELLPPIDARPPVRMIAAARDHAAALIAVADARWDDARAAFRSAMEVYDALEVRLWRSIAGLQFDAYLGQRFEDARQAGEDAEALFAANDAVGFVGRYRAAIRGKPAPPLDGARPGAAERTPVPVDAEQPA